MSDASRVERYRGRDEHHLIGQRLMGDGKLDTGRAGRGRKEEENDMFSSKIVRSIAAVGTGSVAAMAAVAALAAAPSANAYPANNPPTCDAQWLTTYCDGPIQPDGTFKRCGSTLVWIAGIACYVQPQTTCWMVDMSQPLLTNQPQHHINS
jgi:hypothetical protein